MSEMTRVPAPRSFFGGLASGASAFAEGGAFIVGTPGVWGYALVPMIVAMVLTVGLGAAAIAGIVHIAHIVTGPDASGWTTAFAWIAEAALGLVAIMVAVLVAFALAQPLSGFALDAIARRQARALGIAEPPERPGAFWRSLRVTLTGLAISLPLLLLLTLITMMFPPAAVVTVPLKILVSALTLAWDFLDYPLGQHGYGVRERLAWMRAHFGAVLGFGAVGTLVLLVPGMGLLILPMGVAGATRLAILKPRGVSSS